MFATPSLNQHREVILDEIFTKQDFETEGFMLYSKVIYIINMQKGKKWPRILNIVKSVKYLQSLVKGAAPPHQIILHE